jgi:hypothetical protein
VRSARLYREIRSPGRIKENFRDWFTFAWPMWRWTSTILPSACCYARGSFIARIIMRISFNWNCLPCNYNITDIFVANIELSLLCHHSVDNTYYWDKSKFCRIYMLRRFLLNPPSKMSVLIHSRGVCLWYCWNNLARFCFNCDAIIGFFMENIL